MFHPPGQYTHQGADKIMGHNFYMERAILRRWQQLKMILRVGKAQIVDGLGQNPTAPLAEECFKEAMIAPGKLKAEQLYDAYGAR